MPRVSHSPPRAPPIQYTAPNGTRWQKEKAAAAGGAGATASNPFDLPDDPKHIGPWIIGECVGKGASGRVKIAKHRRTGQLAAVKILPLQPLVNSRASLATQQAKSEKQRLGIDREITMMKLMNHPNIMRIYDVFEGEKELFLVLEYVEGGELFDFLVNRGRLPPLEALAYFKQIVYGLNYAHAFSIIHRDLKPENILIHSLNPPLIKIADWGMAAFAPPTLQLETSCGSPHYASPEIVNGDKYEGNATDIWSCGVILYALLTGRLPFDDKNVRTLLSKVKVGKYDMPQFVDPHAKDLISRMLVVDVAKRITIPEILAHPWLETPTPGILYLPAPPVSELARPLRSQAHIDRDLLSSLRVIWGRHADADSITGDLLSPAGEGTLAKAFYFLLHKYRERTMEEHGIVDDVDVGPTEEGRVITKQYVAPPPRQQQQQQQQLAADTTRSPRARTYARAPSPLVSPPPSPSPLSRPPPGLSLPSPVMTRPSSPGPTSPRMRPPSPAGPRPFKARPMSSPVPSHHRHYPHHPHSPNANATSALSAGGVGVSGSRVRTSTPSPSLNYTELAQHQRVYHPSSPVYSHPHPHRPEISSVLFPNTTVEESRGSTPGNEPNAPVDLLPMLTAPRIANIEFQRTIDDITDRVNGMVARGNAEITLGRQYGVASAPPPPQAQGHFSDGVVENKENRDAVPAQAESDPMQMTGGLGLAAKTRGVMGREMGNIIYVGEPAPAEPVKERKERRGRPPTLDFHARGLNTKRSTMSAVGSPTAMSPPAMSSILGSPAVGEFKGWFSNLFNWKAQSYVLYSTESISATRLETIRILERLGVAVVVEDAEGWGVLRCRADDAGLNLKQARFRVDFTLSPGSNSAFANGRSRHSVAIGGGGAGAMSCAIVLVQEKGSVATFRAVYRRLREEWGLDGDVLMSPPAREGMPLGEQAQRFAA